MAKLILTKQDLQFLCLCVSTERRFSEEVGVPLERCELKAIRKVYRARDLAYRYSPDVTAEWEADLAKAPTPLSERAFNDPPS